MRAAFIIAACGVVLSLTHGWAVAQTRGTSGYTARLVPELCGALPCNVSGISFTKGEVHLRGLRQTDLVFNTKIGRIALQNVLPPPSGLQAELSATLSYGAAQEAPPERKQIKVEELIDEVYEALGLGLDVPIRWIVAVEKGLTIDADHDQMFRVLVNIARNAMQALEARGNRDPARDQIRITGRREASVVVIEVSDTGPGVPEKARVHMFQAFQGSTRPGGSGLGLAIAAELVRAHGGDIRLVPGTIGATFSITIPDGAVDLGAHRDARARA